MLKRCDFMMEVFYNKDKCEALSTALRCVDRNQVVCVDGEWGTGKTYFCNKLREASGDDFEFIYIDAFRNDFNSDPLVVLISELSNALDGEEKRRYLDSAAKHAVPIIGKACEFIGSNAPFPASGFVGELASNYIRGKIESYLEVDESIIGMQAEVKKIVDKKSPKRVVVIVDELDRCRPSFSLEMIEKIKHIFDVEGLHFVLSMNKEQMLSSIDHAYGIASSKESYLEKFIDFTIRLEKPVVESHDTNVSAEIDYARRLVRKNFEEFASDDFIEHVVNFSSIILLKNSIGFRGVERFIDKCLTCYVSSGIRIPEGGDRAYACYMCCCVFVSIYNRSALTKTKDCASEEYCKSLLVDNYCFVSDRRYPIYEYKDNLSGGEEDMGGGVFYGFVAAAGSDKAINHVGSKYKNFVDRLVDRRFTYQAFHAWFDYVKSVC
ncbi:hypothetical protein EQG41_08925 [Billgrantia azerbaijanica]|nr:hypothetical protein EQG41_08925 [Halomonas azerbaijanica]